MDTNISDAGLAHSGTGLSAPLGLPGEDTDGTETFHHFQEHRPADTAGHTRPTTGVAGDDRGGGEPPDHHQSRASLGTDPDARLPTSSRKSRRRMLLAGVAVVLLLGVGAIGYGYRQPLRDLAISKGLIAASSSPSTSSASASGPVTSAKNVPAGVKPAVPTTDVAGVREAGLPVGKPAIVVSRQQPVVPLSNATTQAQEITGLKTNPLITASPVVAAIPTTPVSPVLDVDTMVAAPVGPRSTRNQSAASTSALVASKPLATDISIPWQVPQLVVTSVPSPALTEPPAQHPSETTASTAPAAPVDPSLTAAALQAAPLSTAKQVQLLDLVKNLGAQLRDTRAEVTQLRATVVQLSGTVETKITDFDGRLSMAEATTILQSSARAGAPSAPPSAPTMPIAPVARSVPVIVPSARSASRLSVAADAPAASATPPAERRSTKDYTIRGASPGLAVVAALNAAPGSPSVFELAVGDVVPGLGHVKRVYQRGTSWAVDTDGGTIQ